jgi:hypothetical protein
MFISPPRGFLVPGCLSITSQKMGVRFSTSNNPFLLLLPAPHCTIPMHIIQIIIPFPFGIRGAGNERELVKRISQMYFLTINRNISAVQVQPCLIKEP